MLDGLIREIRNSLNYTDWVLPSLHKLIESDATHDTEYYKTLYCLMLNRGNLANTSKALFIHRNTLLYRIEKIQSIIGVDIHNESVYAYLRLCFELMKADHPVF